MEYFFFLFKRLMMEFLGNFSVIFPKLINRKFPFWNIWISMENIPENMSLNNIGIGIMENWKTSDHKSWICGVLD